MKEKKKTLDYASPKLLEAIKKDIDRTKRLNSILPRGGYGYDDRELFMSLEARVRRAINFTLYGNETDQYIDPVEEEGNDKWLTTQPPQE